MNIPNEYLPELRAWLEGMMSCHTYSEQCRARLEELKRQRDNLAEQIEELETCVKEAAEQRERTKRLQDIIAQEEEA